MTESPQSTQKAQSSTIPVKTYEKATPARLRTRMTRISRIFTDQCESASSALSVFHYIPSALICVNLRSIFSIGLLGLNIVLEKVLAFEKPQRAQRTQRKRKCSVFFPVNRKAV